MTPLLSTAEKQALLTALDHATSFFLVVNNDTDTSYVGFAALSGPIEDLGTNIGHALAALDADARFGLLAAMTRALIADKDNPPTARLFNDITDAATPEN
jgi:hypothetical protein